MQFEVENKFAAKDLAAIAGRVEALCGRPCGHESHVDSYLNHPSRDFRASDEALRIRRCNTEVHITWKGPRAGGTVKVREEMELPLAEGTSVEQVQALFLRLGFQWVADVKKERSLYRLERGSKSILICLDQVEGLGAFVEIELLSTQEELESSKQVIRELQSELGFGEPIAASYLKMVLEKRA